MTVEQLDPLWVLPFLVLLAGFCAGLEVSQMPLKSNVPRPPPWEKKPEKGAIFSLVIVVGIIASIFFLMYVLQLYFPYPS